MSRSWNLLGVFRRRDHFDHVVEEKLDKSLHIVTTQHAADEPAEKGFHETYPLDTWEEITVRKGGVELTITSTPGRQGPPVVEKALPPVMGSMLEFQPEEGQTVLRLFITGDTIMYDDLKEIPEHYPILTSLSYIWVGRESSASS